MADRTSITLNVSEATKSALDNVVERHGMKVGIMASRLIDWFVAQDPLLQAIILGHVPSERAEEVLSLVRQRLAQQKRKSG